MPDDVQLRVRVPNDVKDKWDKVLTARKISGQDALEAMMGWIVDEDALTQAMIFKQVPGTDRADLSRIVLERLAASTKGRGGKSGKTWPPAKE